MTGGITHPYYFGHASVIQTAISTGEFRHISHRERYE